MYTNKNTHLTTSRFTELNYRAVTKVLYSSAVSFVMLLHAICIHLIRCYIWQALIQTFFYYLGLDCDIIIWEKHNYTCACALLFLFLPERDLQGRWLFKYWKLSTFQRLSLVASGSQLLHPIQGAVIGGLKKNSLYNRSPMKQCEGVYQHCHVISSSHLAFLRVRLNNQSGQYIGSLFRHI